MFYPIENKKKRGHLWGFAAIALMTTLLLSGCETTREVKTERRTTYTDNNTAGETVIVEDADNMDDDTPLTDSAVTEETTTTTRTQSEDRGFLGTTFHVIGEIIALPFRIVGGILDFIF